MASVWDFPEEHEERLDQCEELLGYRFHDRKLLYAALTHASGAMHRLASNERLEFLGDAILGAVVCELLYHQFPRALEGQLTKIKSVVVSRQTCARLSRKMGIEQVLIVGRGISSDKPVPSSLMADVFESVVAAIYLDGGLDAAKAFVQHCVQSEIDRVASGTSDENFKSLLQHIVQRDFNDTPTYLLKSETGPDHNKYFQVAAHVNGREFSAAWGRNKKEAEQRAAANALAELDNEDPPYPPEIVP